MGDEEEKPKMGLSPAQLAAGAAATVTMSVVGSFFGPAGTLVAAALTSVTSTVATTVYQHVFAISGQKAKRIIARPGESRKQYLDRVADAKLADDRRRFTPKAAYGVAALAAAGIFGGVMVAETGAEAVAGKPVSAIVQGKPGHGTTLGGGRVVKSSPATTPMTSGTPAPSSGSPAPVTQRPTPSPVVSSVPIPAVPPPPATPIIPPPSTELPPPSSGPAPQGT